MHVNNQMRFGLCPARATWDGEEWIYLLPDGLGSVRQLADEQGDIIRRYSYSPFGQVLAAEGERINPLQYTGEHWDGDVGLLYLRARWYDPATGRFLTKDPFPGFAALPQTQHPYVYVGNNPINLTDPSGEFAFIPLLLVGAAGGALGGLGYYAIRTALNPCVDWNWEEAIFWGGVGTGIGAILGSGIYGGWWIGTQLGWWGTAAGGGIGYGASRLYTAVEVAQSKLNYLLTSPGKATGFDRLGYTLENSKALHNTLISIGQKVSSVDVSTVTQYGTKFEKAIEIIGPTGMEARLVTVWQVDQGSEVLRLITAWAEVYK